MWCYEKHECTYCCDGLYDEYWNRHHMLYDMCVTIIISGIMYEQWSSWVIWWIYVYTLHTLNGWYSDAHGLYNLSVNGVDMMHTIHILYQSWETEEYEYLSTMKRSLYIERYAYNMMQIPHMIERALELNADTLFVYYLSTCEHRCKHYVNL